MPASAGPHEVCPDETTVFEVIATDTAIEGEFGRASQSAFADIQIEVEDAAREACSGDGGVIEPPPGERELCSIAIPFQGTPQYFANMGTALSTDEHGNLYVLGTNDSTIELAGTTMPVTGAKDAFVAKYDPSCELLWSKTIGCPGCDISLYGSDVGPSEVVAVGNARAELDLEVVSTGERWVDAALLVQLDRETGALTRGAVYEAPGSVSSLFDVGIDARGDIAFIGSTLDPLTIEGVPLLATEQLFVAKITAAGEYVFGYPIEYSRQTGRIAVHPDGDIAVSGWAEGAVQIGATSLPLQATGMRRFVAAMTADAEVTTLRELDMDVPNGAHGYIDNTIAIDRDHNIIVEQHAFLESTGDRELPEQLMKLDELGNHVWTRDVSSSEEHWISAAKGAIATDAHGNIIHTDEIEVGQPTPGARADNDALVRKLSPDGTELWRHQLDTDRYEVVWGVAVAPDDSVWVAHGFFAASVNDLSGTLRITKLAP